MVALGCLVMAGLAPAVAPGLLAFLSSEAAVEFAAAAAGALVAAVLPAAGLLVAGLVAAGAAVLLAAGLLLGAAAAGDLVAGATPPPLVPFFAGFLAGLPAAAADLPLSVVAAVLASSPAWSGTDVTSLVTWFSTMSKKGDQVMFQKCIKLESIANLEPPTQIFIAD